ncbi:MAG: hypothetical protein M3457_03750, partial [Chloroflexota bacterium]|nr:hypothetical protein [Chloroflexota bacterium]
MRTLLALVVAGTLVASSPVAAAADQVGADRLREALEAYLGRPGPADPSAVSVQPTGESYRVSIDPKLLLRPLAQFGIELSVSELSFLTAPQPDGTWRVSEWPTSLAMELKLLGETTAYRAEGIFSDGIYDPRLRLFTTYSQTNGSVTSNSNGPTGRSETRQGEQRVDSTAVAVDEGVADIRGRQTIADMAADNELLFPDEATGITSSTKVSYRVQSLEDEFRMDAVRSRMLADLWAFLVSHPTRARMAVDQSELKSLLAEFLPVFTRLEDSGTARGITVDTDLGSFAVDRIGWTLGLNGIVADGSVLARLEVEGISRPDGLAPAWSSGLIPTEFGSELSVTGYDFAAPVRQLIRDFDLNKDVPIAPAVLQGAFANVLPDEGLKVTLAPSRIATPLMNIDLSGEMNVIGPAATGRVDIRATGLVAAIEAVQAAGPNDQQAAQVLAVLSSAQILGRPDPDGFTSW